MFETVFILIFATLLVAVPLRIVGALYTSICEAWSRWSYHAAVIREQRRQAAMRSASNRVHSDARSRMEQRRNNRADARRRREKEAEERQTKKKQLIDAENARRAAASDQRRRNDARAVCECRWGAYAPQISKKFSRADFDRFLKSFMTDTHAADEVETRARQLLEILDAFYEQREESKPARRFETLEEVTNWFIEQQERIGRLPLDEQTREEHLARLNATYSELSERMLETPR